MSGQLYEAQALLRLCLEHGAYGFYIGSDNERWERWMGRNESSAKKEMVRKEFSHGKIKRYIQDSSPKLGEHFVKLYDSFIDFGAHPNEQGFSLNSAIRKDGGNVHFDTIYLQGDGIALKVGLKTTVWVGIWVLQIAQLLYSERFQILGIRDDLDKVRFRY